jgi:hypothetical protein
LATKESGHHLCITVLFLLICITVNYWCVFAVAFSTNLNINWICVCYCVLLYISIWLTSTINNTCLLSTENLIMFVALFCIEQRLVCLIDIVTITWRLLKKLNKVNLKCRKDRRKIMYNLHTNLDISMSDKLGFLCEKLQLNIRPVALE